MNNWTQEQKNEATERDNLYYHFLEQETRDAPLVLQPALLIARSCKINSAIWDYFIVAYMAFGLLMFAISFSFYEQLIHRLLLSAIEWIHGNATVTRSQLPPGWD